MFYLADARSIVEAREQRTLQRSQFFPISPSLKLVNLRELKKSYKHALSRAWITLGAIGESDWWICKPFLPDLAEGFALRNSSDKSTSATLDLFLHLNTPMKANCTTWRKKSFYGRYHALVAICWNEYCRSSPMYPTSFIPSQLLDHRKDNF